MTRQTRIRTIALAPAGILCITLVAWNREPVYRTQHTVHYQDTVPAPARSGSMRNSDKPRDFDKELKQLDEATERLNSHSTDHWDKVGNDLQIELSKINFDEIQINTEKILKDVDFKKINEDLSSALADINLDEIQVNLDKSLSNLNINVDIKSGELREALAQARSAIRKGLSEAKKVSNDEVKQALRDASEEIKKAQIESSDEVKKAMKDAGKEIRRSLSEIKIDKSVMTESMNKAKTGIEQAKLELKGYQEMVYEMEKDGLLNTDDDYRIRYTEGNLTVNGKDQNSETAEKYKKYFGSKSVVLKKADGKISVNRFNDDSNDDENNGENR